MHPRQDIHNLAAPRSSGNTAWAGGLFWRLPCADRRAWLKVAAWFWSPRILYFRARCCFNSAGGSERDRRGWSGGIVGSRMRIADLAKRRAAGWIAQQIGNRRIRKGPFDIGHGGVQLPMQRAQVCAV